MTVPAGSGPETGFRPFAAVKCVLNIGRQEKNALSLNEKRVKSAVNGKKTL